MNQSINNFFYLLDIGYFEEESVLRFEQLARKISAEAHYLKSQHMESSFMPQTKKEYSQQIHGSKYGTNCNSTINGFKHWDDRRQEEQMKGDKKNLPDRNKCRKNLPDNFFLPINERPNGSVDMMSVGYEEEHSFQPFIVYNFGKSYDSDFLHSLVLDCYSGLSSSLLKVADKIAIAIRKIEIENNVKYSTLDLSQRKGDDFRDLLGFLFIPSPTQKNDIKLKSGIFMANAILQ